MKLNPGDGNARFLWRRWSAGCQTTLARKALAAGRRQECIFRLRQAIQICPESQFGADAKFWLPLIEKSQ